MSCPEKYTAYMHDYLDEDISEQRALELSEHIQSCGTCEEHFKELKRTIALVQGTAHIKAPEGFTEDIMAKLPKEKRKVELNRWFKNHPFLSAASLFFLLMAGSLFSNWNQEEQFSYSKQPNILVENDTVIVPEGEVVKGDILVRNGKVQIEGEVQGDVTVINGEISGEKYLAAAGKVTGEISEVNEIFDWIWYHIKTTVKNTFNMNEDEERSLQ
ncbi:Transmembrane transcriptional regulator (anti-sigma factor RsiW) [Mesobacillus persicus]|uniref:Transmembrane transcriptional regulator (Anti-sigma factor RsiW) n=1 Tax=Mesobacillus persicus TaxID=930146 RepID=A0A1H8KDM6_9BACI|nr:anti-sigma factor [Mesobacillus persicus]SEN91082.1 Transmembrane transcriptional regulator (anti-sigma factor RsiW) [Mesobacillus persicus]